MTYINANGDRDADFSLIDMSPVSGDWRVREFKFAVYIYSHLQQRYILRLHFKSNPLSDIIQKLELYIGIHC